MCLRDAVEPPREKPDSIQRPKGPKPGRSPVTVSTNYVDQIVAALTRRLDDCEIDLLRQHALLVLVTGEQATEQHAHDAWAAWRIATNPGHRLLVPFDHLTAEAQALNTPYADAIRAVATRLRERDNHVERRSEALV
jgi:hypothetical protein